ncbi:MAG TPA: SMP-30/gluconolactonase/LRE family protein [Candidatus Cybelea sp.]|jgi:hypothetical protein|nr:SMP-30/gluconolactonase/LRE family protein [Candidatus Cybelea sp.]
MARHFLVPFAAAAILAACSSGSGGSPSSSSLTPVGLAPNGHGIKQPPTVAARPDVAPRPDHHKSWVAPDIGKAPRLLFIPDYGTGDVYVFTMPAMVLKATLTGFSFPEGACSDASGRIWIADTGASQMLQYSRTGTLLNTISIPGEYPAGCAINYATNDLAVSNIESTTGGAGSIMIFKNASGSPTTYTNPSFFLYFFVGYDNNGNLFFDGMDSGRTTSYFAELPSGGSNTQLISLSGGTLHVAGFIQWYKIGNYLALGDQQCGGSPSACVYWVTVAGSTGTITATTNLSNYQGGQVCDLAEGVIAGNGERYVAGPDYEATCSFTPTTANRWPYEGGGTPTNYNNTTSFGEPLGAAVSAK